MTQEAVLIKWKHSNSYFKFSTLRDYNNLIKFNFFLACAWVVNTSLTEAERIRDRAAEHGGES